MAEESKMETSNSDVWSPDVFCENYPHGNGARVTSTPYWALSLKKLNESEELSKQDSGYISATPRSFESAGLHFDRCQHCNASLHLSHSKSTPENVCTCFNQHINANSSDVKCMDAIQEVKLSPTPKRPPRIRQNRPPEFYVDDAIDTSLYTEEMEVDNSSIAENHQCSLDLVDLGEEKSIDFLEPEVFSASQNSAKETPTCITSKFSAKLENNEEDINSPSYEKAECSFMKVSSEDFCSPGIFSCDIVSPKRKSEPSPTKPKIGTPSKKIEKDNLFKNSAKKVATMNKVLRSFYSLNGLENIDFLYQFGVKKNCPHIVTRILSFLPEKDLDAVRVVSKTWNKLLYNDYAAFNRWQLHFTAMRLMKENLSSPVKQGGSGGRNRPALTRLQLVTNQTSPPRQLFTPSPPVSPGSARFRSYQKAARSLKKNERLLPCPRCRFPSTDRGDPVVQCPRSGCRHRFCVWCNIEVLPGLPHNCPPLYNPSCITRKPKTTHTAGSKVSKRNLRRL